MDDSRAGRRDQGRSSLPTAAPHLSDLVFKIMLGVKSLQSFSTGYLPHSVFARLKRQRRAGSKVQPIRLRSEEAECKRCGEGLGLAHAAAEALDLLSVRAHFIPPEEEVEKKPPKNPNNL